MTKNILTSILLWFFFMSASANTAKDLAKWNAKCTLDKVEVTLEVNSKSGDPYEDDMTAKIIFDKKVLNVPVGNGFFKKIELTSPSNICDKTLGFKINQNQLLLLFLIDNRPSHDILATLLIDTSTQDILDLNKNLGSASQLKIEKTNHGFRALLAQGWNKKAKTDSNQEIHSGWMEVRVQDSNVLAEWEMPLPKTHKPYSHSHVHPK